MQSQAVSPCWTHLIDCFLDGSKVALYLSWMIHQRSMCGRLCQHSMFWFVLVLVLLLLKAGLGYAH